VVKELVSKTGPDPILFVKDLVLKDNGISDQGMMMILEALEAQGGLISMTIWNNLLGSCSSRRLSAFLTHKDLKQLSLKNPSMDTAAVTDLIAALADAASLVKLELVQIPHLCLKENVDQLCESLAGLDELRHLSLSDNGFKPGHLVMLATLFAEARRLDLRSVDLSFNQLQQIRTKVPSSDGLGQSPALKAADSNPVQSKKSKPQKQAPESPSDLQSFYTAMN
jgi:Ran GTPase-activating protein (RanGAP) involved in mRNA processing and transport